MFPTTQATLWLSGLGALGIPAKTIETQRVAIRCLVGTAVVLVLTDVATLLAGIPAT
jgi:hypothetical protein